MSRTLTTANRDDDLDFDDRKKAKSSEIVMSDEFFKVENDEMARMMEEVMPTIAEAGKAADFEGKSGAKPKAKGSVAKVKNAATKAADGEAKSTISGTKIK